MILSSILIITALAVFFILKSCKKAPELQNNEGYIQVDGGKIWYEICGEGNKTPLLLLHGGPGAPSYYLEPMKALGKERKLIFYHQLGCGKSDRITDTSLMTVKHYVEELRTLVKHFGIKEFYLYGQSWGAMLAMDYYMKYPKGVKALIFSSPCLSTPVWLADAAVLIGQLPEEVQESIRINERAKTYANPDYAQAVQEFYKHFVARKQPWSAEIERTFSEMGSNYQYMWGPSEFNATGELAGYDRTEELAGIKIPTLFVCGEFDEATPPSVEFFKSRVPGAQMAVIKGAAHLTMQDEPEQNNKVISDFLNSLHTKITL